MITAEGIGRRYGGRPAITDVHLSVAPGEVVALLGPNGAGKSTTIRVLLGLTRPHSGRVHLGGRAGYLPEAFAGYDGLAVEGYLRFQCRMRRLPASAIEPAMLAAGVADVAGRPMGRLSRGQRQRVGLAQAVLGAPEVLVLDEPGSGLDPQQLVEARSLIRGAADRGAAVLVSTHQLGEAARVADRVVVVVAGRVVAEERPGDAGALEARYLGLVAP